MPDYLKAYIAALSAEESFTEARQRAEFEARLRRACQALETPYREAIRLRGMSDALRAEIARGAADGTPEEDLLDLALRCIASLCGDEGFYRHVGGLLAARSGNLAVDQAEQITLRSHKREYNHLLARMHSILSNATDPLLDEQHQRQAMDSLQDINDRMRTVLARIHDYTGQQAVEGFDLRASDADELPAEEDITLSGMPALRPGTRDPVQPAATAPAAAPSAARAAPSDPAHAGAPPLTVSATPTLSRAMPTSPYGAPAPHRPEPRGDA